MSGKPSTPRVVHQAFEWLPKGQSLPEGLWRTRHRALSHLLSAHVVGIFVYALLSGYSFVHSCLEASIVGAFALMSHATRMSRRSRSAVTALGLVMASAVLVHVSGGVIELHFHFFVMVGILTLYQDWVPFLGAIGFVVFHHGVVGTLSPGQVYNHPDAIAHPFKWAFIHGGFVLAASVASIVAWRLNEEQALKDSLTGLPNRRLFQDRVSHALTRQRNPANMAVLFIDLDGFKDVNDSLGHAAGDQILTTVAERIRSVLRSGDTPARFGGDEFAVLVEEIGTISGASRIADRILDALMVPVVVRGMEIAVGASIGIAGAEPDMGTEELLRNADVAMYTAKRNGRGRHELYEAGMHATIVRRVDLERDIQRAIDQEEFELRYQPIVHLASGRISGVEALLRWNHPDRGLLSPVDFLELMESNGSIVKVGGWVLEEACRQGRIWKDRYPQHPLTMAINLSPRQLSEPDIVSVVERSLSAANLPASDVVLELTEGVMVKDTEVIISRLHGLKEIGVHLAVDDFGTGYSSLSYLRRLPFDILKIDKLFIDGINDGPTESAFALAIVKLARTLELEIVAEGVEDAHQAALLRDLGCETAQGYYFSRPLPPDGVDELLARSPSGARV